MASKAATAAVVRPSRYAVKLRAVFLTYSTTIQDFTRIYSTLGLGKGITPSLTLKNNYKLTHAPSTYLPLVRDCRRFTGIPQAPFGCPAHLESTKCPTDDRGPGSLSLCPKE